MTACAVLTLYGLSPLPEVTAEDLWLKPAQRRSEQLHCRREGSSAGQAFPTVCATTPPRQPPWRWCRSATLTCRALRRTRQCIYPGAQNAENGSVPNNMGR